MINQHLKELIPTGDAVQVLKKFEDRYKFSRFNDLIYFITTDLEKVNSFDEKIKVKFGRSNGSFERRWSAYCHHSITMPFLIAVITIPNMEHYKLFYPDTEFDNIPNVYNEEKKIKNIFKDRTYMEKSKEKIEVSINEVCDYLEKRQSEINEMYDEYNLDYEMWRLPVEDKDGNMQCRIKYHYQLEKEKQLEELKRKEEEEENNKPIPLRKWGEKMSSEMRINIALAKERL
jgi:tRNA nucleotidyltransferase/poly(A) polymerase